MFNIIKESFGITNKYIILATPLILFSLVSTIYLAIASGGRVIGLIFAVILFLLMCCAFAAGWFNMVSLSVKDAEKDEPNSLIKYFVSGVGEYFLPVLGTMLVMAVIGTILLVLATILGYKFIGNPNVSTTALSAAMTSVESMKNFLATLTMEQLIKINLWNLLLFFAVSFSYYIVLFYFPALFFKTKNPIKAFLYSQKDLYTRHFFKNIGFYLLIFILYITLSIFTTLGGANIVLHFIFTLVNFYFMVYFSVLIFNYYYSNYIKIGSKVDEVI